MSHSYKILKRFSFIYINFHSEPFDIPFDNSIKNAFGR